MGAIHTILREKILNSYKYFFDINYILRDFAVTNVVFFSIQEKKSVNFLAKRAELRYNV